MSASEEIPSMVELDTRQLREVVFLIPGAERIVEGGCHEDGASTNGTGGESVVLASDEIQEGRVGSGQ